MIIFRQNEYSIFSWLFKKKDKNKDLENKSSEEECEVESKIICGKITFSEFANNEPWPALVSMGIKPDDTKNDGGWGEFNKWMKEKKFITGGNITKVYTLSDNVKGKNGLTCCVIIFSPGTKIDSGTRLAYGTTFKWPEDFIYNYSSWYKSGKNM